MDADSPSPVRDSESPSPLKNEPSHDDQTNDVKKSRTQSIEDDCLIADNTHELVMEKLENYKAELAAMDRKK